MDIIVILELYVFRHFFICNTSQRCTNIIRLSNLVQQLHVCFMQNKKKRLAGYPFSFLSLNLQHHHQLTVAF